MGHGNEVFHGSYRQINKTRQFYGLQNWCRSGLITSLLACLHDHNKSGFFGGPAFIQLIRAI